MSTERFVKAMNATDIKPGQAKVVRVEDKQIAVFRLDEEKYCAIDNRCPHEGYPLVQGTMNDCVLTCDWHNWKFDLNDGKCTRGGEDVRSYPVQIDNGDLKIDIAEPDSNDSIPQFLKSIQAAMAENDDSRAARDIIRLLKLGVEEKKIFTEIALFGASRDGEGNDFHGWDHGMAVLLDSTKALRFYEGFDRVIPLVQGLSAVAEPRLRQGLRPMPEPVDISKYGSLHDARAEFRRFVETEQPEAAEALLRGLLASNPPREEIRAWIFAIVTDHFLSYGHRMIYAVKALQMLDVIGWEHAEQLLPCLAPTTVWATREDRLPYMRKFQARLRQVEPELPDLFARQAAAQGNLDEAAFRRALLEGNSEDAFDSVDKALRSNVPVSKIIRAIALAAAERCLRFNISIDLDRSKEEGWLFVTHAFTHASAVREAYEMQPSPELLRAVYQAAYFVQYVRKPGNCLLDLPPEKRDPACSPLEHIDWSDLAESSDEKLLDRLIEEIETLQYSAATRTARGYLETGRPASKLTAKLIKYAFADSAGVPIVLAHTIKTTVAAVEEFNALEGHPFAWLTIAAAVRFLASPKRERFAFYGALQAIDFVANSRAKEA